MKIEPRGKYSGVKVHLDGPEAEEIVKYFEANGTGLPSTIVGTTATLPHKHVTRLGKKIKALLLEVPDLLKDRTEEQVKQALVRDQQKIVEQLKALETGNDWKF